jgi:hypothetical protein
MKKQILFTITLLICSINSFSQIIFERGYFIDESNKKIECFIKNKDWLNNPTTFKYKLSENGILQEASINDVKEFSITNVAKYIRVKTKVDKSSEQLNHMSSTNKPIFVEKVLFLKVLVEGKASLYQYNNGNMTRFFYNLKDTKIEQLVYKKYLIGEKIHTNEYFKQQLLVSLKCKNIKLKDIKYLPYRKNNLEKLFIRYNENTESKFNYYSSKNRKKLFHISIKSGLNICNLKLDNSLSPYKNIKSSNDIGFKFGVEGEFIFPFNKNKWAFIFEPTFQCINTKNESNSRVYSGLLVSELNYKSIELPVGLRHYFFLNNNSKLFINFLYVADYSINSKVKFSRKNEDPFLTLDVKSKNNLAMGIGYKFKDKYSIEMRYNTKRNILKDYVYWKSDFRSISITIGYTLF